MEDLMLTHTPSRVIVTPDRFTDPDGRTYEVTHDDDLEDPRDGLEGAELHVYRAGNRDSLSLPASDIGAAFNAMYRDEEDPVTALHLLRGVLPSGTVAHLGSVTGWVQGDWADYVVVAPDVATAEALASDFGMYFRGDVWQVTDGETGETHGGIYAESMEAAVRSFIAGL